MARDSQHSGDVSHGDGGQSGGLPQLNPDSFASQLFWLAVVFTFLYLVMARSILPRIQGVLGARESKLQHDLDAAEHAKLAAHAARTSYEAELVNAKQQSIDLLARTQRELEAHMAQEQTTLQVKIDAMITDSKQRLEVQRVSALEEMKPFIEELTGLAAERFLGKAPTKAQISKAMKS